MRAHGIDGRGRRRAVAVAALCLGLLLIGGSEVTLSAEHSGRHHDPDAEPEHAYLGVRISEETEHSEGGARVDLVVADSPAARAGLRAGDVIVEFAGEPIRGPMRLTERIHAREPGETVEIVVLRDGSSERLYAELGERRTRWLVAPLADDSEWIAEMERQAEELAERHQELEKLYSEQLAEQELLRKEGQVEDRAREYERMAERMAERARVLAERHGLLQYDLRFGSRPKLGVQLTETTPELRRHLGGDENAGVLVNRVLPGTPAETHGVRVGDLILSVDGVPVASASELVRELADKDGSTVLLVVVRDGSRTEVRVEIPAAPEEDEPGPQARVRDDVLGELTRAAREVRRVEHERQRLLAHLEGSI